VRAFNAAGQIAQLDIGLFANWINAFASENYRLTPYFEVALFCGSGKF